MPKKPKNRSSKQTKQRHQAKARAARQDQQVDAILNTTREAFPAAFAAGEFTVLTDDGPRTVTLEQMRQRINASLASDGEPPLEDLNELAGMLNEEMLMANVFLAPDGLWRFPEEYLPEARQA
jgi:hypothetical protein